MARNIVVADSDTLIEKAVSLWKETAEREIESKGIFTVALSGGKTPGGFYRELACRPDLPFWPRTHLFQVDERHLRPDHPDSNLGMINKLLVDKVELPAANIHAVRYHATLDESVRAYREEISGFFNPHPGNVPEFDIIFLGIGDDGHTASLFPNDRALTVDDQPVTGVVLGETRHDRVTLTFPVLNAAHRIVFLAEGKGKASALKQVFADENVPPAGLVKARDITFLLDPAAASALDTSFVP